MAISIQTRAARLLVEIGFLGLSRGLPKHSVIVFSALASLRPDEEAATIGLGMSLLADGDPTRAVAALKTGPQTDSVLAFSCLAHARNGDKPMAAELRDELQDRGAAQDLLDIANNAVNGD